MDNSNCVINSYKGTNVGGVSNSGIPEGARWHRMIAPGSQKEMAGQRRHYHLIKETYPGFTENSTKS